MRSILFRSANPGTTEGIRKLKQDSREFGRVSLASMAHGDSLSALRRDRCSRQAPLPPFRFNKSESNRY